MRRPQSRVVLVEPYQRPFPQPYVQLYKNSLGTGGSFLYRPRLGLTRLALPAAYASDTLRPWNAKTLEVQTDHGNPWMLSDQDAMWNTHYAKVGSCLINSGTSVKFRRVDGYTEANNLLAGGVTTWTIDKTLHKYSYEFILDNDLDATSPTVIYDDVETLWSAVGAGSAVAEEAVIVAKGTSSLKITVLLGIANSGGLYTLAADADYSANEFLCFYLYGANSGDAITVKLLDSIDTNGRSIAITENFTGWKRFVVPILAMTVVGTGALTAARKFYVLYDNPSVNRTLYVDQVQPDVGQWCGIEAYIPDLLAAGQSVKLYSWTGAAYEEFASWDAEDDSTAETVTGAKLEYLDGTASPSIWAAMTSCLGLFTKSTRGAVAGVAYGTQALTYSAYYGVKQRIGAAFKLAPDDGQDSSTAGISQVRLKIEVFYSSVSDIRNNWTPKFGASSYEFENSNNAYYGLTNLNDAWLALFNPTTGVAEYLIFTEKPTGLVVRADENEEIDSLEITTGGRIYAGSYHHSNMTVDSDGDGVPDFLEEVYEPSLVLDLSMDAIVGGKVLDQTANHNDGTLVGPLHLPTLVAGKIGNGILLDDVEDYLSVANNASINFTSGDFTLMAWIKLNQKDVYQCLMEKGIPFNNGWEFFVWNSNILFFRTYQSTGTQESKALTALDTGIWYHVCCVRSGASCIPCLNGASNINAVDAHINPAANADEMKIGQRADGSVPVRGIVDDVRVYNIALPIAEIRQIYDTGRRGHAESIPGLSKGVAIIT